jgi:hypothetical protein
MDFVASFALGKEGEICKLSWGDVGVDVVNVTKGFAQKSGRRGVSMLWGQKTTTSSHQAPKSFKRGCLAG